MMLKVIFALVLHALASFFRYKGGQLYFHFVKMIMEVRLCVDQVHIFKGVGLTLIRNQQLFLQLDYIPQMVFLLGVQMISHHQTQSYYFIRLCLY